MVKRGSSCLAWHPISQKKRGDVVSPQRNSSAQSKVGGISADPNQNEGEEADNASVVGKCRGISGHSQPERVAAHFIRNLDRRRKHCRSADRVGTRDHSRRGNLPLTAPLGAQL